jgi:hypothetical protein
MKPKTDLPAWIKPITIQDAMAEHAAFWDPIIKNKPWPKIIRENLCNSCQNQNLTQGKK